MKTIKFLLAFVLLGVTMIGTAKFMPVVSKSMMSNSDIKISDFDDEGVYTYSITPNINLK